MYCFAFVCFLYVLVRCWFCPRVLCIVCVAVCCCFSMCVVVFLFFVKAAELEELNRKLRKLRWYHQQKVLGSASVIVLRCCFVLLLYNGLLCLFVCLFVLVISYCLCVRLLACCVFFVIDVLLLLCLFCCYYLVVCCLSVCV